MTWIQMAFDLSPSGIELRTLESPLFETVHDDESARAQLEQIQDGVWDRVLTAAALSR